MPTVMGLKESTASTRATEHGGDANNADEKNRPVLLNSAQSQPGVMKPSPPLLPPTRPAWKDPFATLLASLAGFLLVTQGGINANLKQHAVPFSLAAACASFSVGAFFTLILAITTMPRIGMTTIRSAPWYAFLGGFLGPCYVASAVFLLSNGLGFAVFQLCSITGLLVTSLLLDLFGFLHLPKKPMSCRKIAAVIALIGGAVLISSDMSLGEQPVWQAILHLCWATCTGAVFPLQGCFNGVLSALNHFEYNFPCKCRVIHLLQIRFW